MRRLLLRFAISLSMATASIAQTTWRSVTLSGTVDQVQPWTGIVLWSDHEQVANDAIALEYSYVKYNDVVDASGEWIETVGSKLPEWYDSTPSSHPATLDLSWPLKADDPWNESKNVGQYIWGRVNPNPNRHRFLRYRVAILKPLLMSPHSRRWDEPTTNLAS